MEMSLPPHTGFCVLRLFVSGALGRERFVGEWLHGRDEEKT